MIESLDKRGLGVGYLIGTGCSLIIGLFGFFLFTFETFPVALVGTMAALLLTATLPIIGYWLYRGPLPNSSVWRIANWSALGIAISTTLAVGIIIVRIQYPSISMFPSLLVNNIAAGAVLGVLFGSVTELRRRYTESVELTQHNTVMNRVLRHDIRNSMSVIIGFAEHAASTNDADDHTLAMIRDTAYDVVRLGNTARNIEKILNDESNGSVDVQKVIDSEVDRLRTNYPTASFTVDFPADTRIAVNDLFIFVVRNLLETSIERTDSTINISISVYVMDEANGRFAIELMADGVLANDWEKSAVFEADETTHRHDDGLDMWLVKWFTDHYGESLRIEPDGFEGDSLLLELIADEIVVEQHQESLIERIPVVP